VPETAVLIVSQYVAQLLSRRRGDSPPDALSSRELEVLGLMAEGALQHRHRVQTRSHGRGGREHVANILTKLRRPPSSEDHRRVLAAVTYLRDS
jgi:hypothetical protein